MEKVHTRHILTYKVLNSDGYLVLETEDKFEALNKGLEILFSENKVKINHGPGLLWDFDIEKSLDPKGEYHNNKIPPFFWETLDDETREKLK